MTKRTLLHYTNIRFLIIGSICFLTLFVLIGCKQSKSKDSDEAEVSQIVYKKQTIPFLWLSDDNTITINKDYSAEITAPEKAAIGYVATFVGNNCFWDGETNLQRNNLKCDVLTALNLGYQCSEQHLGFLKQWFAQDSMALLELENCHRTPNTATIQNSLEEILVTTEDNMITIFFKASGVNFRAQKSWSWTETNYFEAYTDHLLLVNKVKSEVVYTEF